MASGPSGRLETPDLIMIAAIVVMTALVTWQTFALRSPSSSDDAYIAFRYAQNLAGGQGLIFNPGERIWAYTSPLQVLVLAAVGVLGADIALFAVVFGIVANALSAWLAFRLATRVVDRGAALVVGLLVLASHVTFQYLALETPLVGVLLWGFVTLACHDRPTLTGLVGALACLARPDSMLLVIPILLLSPSLRTARAWVAFAVPGLAWIGFCALYYGDILPHSLRAKFGGAPRGDYVAWILGQYARWAPSPSSVLAHVLVMAIAVAAAIVIARTPRVRTIRPLAVALGGYPLAMFVAYVVMRPSIGHDWEYWNALAFNLTAILIAGVIVVERMPAAARVLPRARPVILVIALAMSAYGAWSKLAGIAASDDAHWDGARYRSYAAVATWLRSNAPGASLFSGEPGILAYLIDAPVYDGFLVSRAPETPPDYLLLQGDHAATESFGTHYLRVHDFPANGFERLSLLARAR